MSDPRIPIFDLDGTLLDSDDALVAPFLELGVPAGELSFGHAVGPECDRLGISLDRYVDLYDTGAAQPFDGAGEMVAALDRWAICSNKHQLSGRAELFRLGWDPEVAMFADAFAGEPKQLAPVLAALGLPATAVFFVGDTEHDRACAESVGCEFYWAGWNPRAAAAGPVGQVLETPADILRLL